jgi:hypothetical protein
MGADGPRFVARSASEYFGGGFPCCEGLFMSTTSNEGAGST